MRFDSTEKLDITSLRTAIDSFARSLKIAERFSGDEDHDAIEVIRAGVIQNFEFTYELCWKFMKRWLEMNVAPDIGLGVNRREFYRICTENALIDNVDRWMEFHRARNETSHIRLPSLAASQTHSRSRICHIAWTW